MRTFVPLLAARKALLMAVAALLAAGGCQEAKQAPKKTQASGGGGGGLLHELQSEMLSSNKATREGVALDIYFDVSGSSTNLRDPLGKLLESVVDTYPDAIPYTYSFYGRESLLQDSGVTNVQSIRRAAKAWSASKLADNTTNLGQAFRRIRERAEESPKTQFAAIIVSDGGFEDMDKAPVELRKLRACPNVRELTFVGVHTGDNSKLQRLSELTKGSGESSGGPSIHLVTDANGDAASRSAREDLRELIGNARKVD
jgi:hypothetical protein